MYELIFRYIYVKFTLIEGSRENYQVIQVPYDYTVEVTNRLKGLDLIDKVPEELWMEVHNIVQQAVVKTVPKKKKSRKVEWLSEED